MILGSHNSWSFRTPKKLWMKTLAFTARCQRKTIKEQYEKYGVRCFDLRIRWFDCTPHVVHNDFDYGTFNDIVSDIVYLNNQRNVWIRLIHDVRSAKDYTSQSVHLFKCFCEAMLDDFPNITWWCGRNLYNWEKDYDFGLEPYCSEMYSSVCPPKIIDDWIPIAYAKLNNKKIRKAAESQKEGILLIDFVDIN